MTSPEDCAKELYEQGLKSSTRKELTTWDATVTLDYNDHSKISTVTLEVDVPETRFLTKTHCWRNFSSLEDAIACKKALKARLKFSTAGKLVYLSCLLSFIQILYNLWVG